MQSRDTKNLTLDKDIDEMLSRVKQTGCNESTRTKIFWRHFLSKLTETQERTPMIVELLDTPASSTSRVRDAIHPVQFGIFPKRLLLPCPDDEILSGYEEDVSSMRDGHTAWVKADPACILERHLVNLNSANPAFREAQDRKHSPTNEEYRFDTDVPNRLTEQMRLSIFNRKGAIEKHIAGIWHIITLQEAIDDLDHEYLTIRFYVTHHGGCAVLFKKDTFQSNIKVTSVYLHDTRDGQQVTRTSRLLLCTSMIPETVNDRP